MPSFGNYQAFLESVEESGGSDGLPVVPPTADRVEGFLRSAGLSGSEGLLDGDPHAFPVSAEEVAVGAVLAGCGPEHAPAVVAAVRAHFDRRRSDGWDAADLRDAALCVIVSGPARHALDLQCGPQCFGPGFVSNATIGRAVNLVVREVEARSPRAEPAFSTPDAYSFCFGEDEEHSPWETHHTERGLAPDTSAVTVHSVQASLPSTEASSRKPEGVLDTLVDTLQSPPALAGRWPGRAAHLAFVVGTEQQRIFADAGWTRAEIRAYLWPRLCEPHTGRPALRLGEPEEAPIVAAGGRGMSWIWILVSYTLAPALREIEAERSE